MVLTSSVTPTSDGAKHSSELLRVWWLDLVWQANWPNGFVEFDSLRCFQDANIVQNLSLGDFVFFVARDFIKKVGGLIFFFRCFRVGADEDFVCRWALIPADKAMSSCQDVSLVDDRTVAELAVAAKSDIREHSNMRMAALASNFTTNDSASV